MPSRTHYITFTQAKQRLKTSSDDSGLALRIRDLIGEASRFLDSETGRRFDWYYDTGVYDSIRAERGGVVDGTRFWVRRDLIQFDVVKRDSVTIDNAELVLYPRWGDAPAYDAIEHLDEKFTWLAYIDGSPRNALTVNGIWGYGGRWEQSAITATVDDSALTITTSGTGHGLEQESIIRLGDEFLRVTADSETTTVAVERGYNGSTASAHTDATIEIFQADDRVKRVVGRMVSWFSALQANPMYGTQTVGDISFPVDLTSFPKDIRHSITQLVKVGGF